MPFILYPPRSPLLCFSEWAYHPSPLPNWKHTVPLTPNLSSSSSRALLSLHLFTERCLHSLDFSKTWHSPEDTSFPAHFSHITQTTKSPEILSSFPLLLMHHFFPSHAKISWLKFMASSYFTFSVLCGHDVVHVPDFPVFGTRLPVSSLPPVPSSSWMTSTFLRKSHPAPLPQLLTAFASTEFWPFASRVTHQAVS